MHIQHLQLDALARDLDDLAATGLVPEPPELAQARDAIRRAADAVSEAPSGSAGPDADRALTLARMALDRARRAAGAAGRPRPSWRDALHAPRPAPDAADGDDRPLASPARDSDFELDSEIPETNPEKAAIEASVAGAFAGVKGRWRVAILVQPHAPWWGVRVEGGSICWTGTLEGPDEQSPEFLAGRVREAVRLGLMQAALRRPNNRG